jgi:hypothetical protein
MKKQTQTNLVHHLRLGKRQGLAHKARQALAQGVIPALDVRRLPGVFATRRMLLIGDHLLIGVPEIRIAVPRLIASWDCLPQLATGLFTAVTDDEGHHLTRGATQGDPYPTLIRALENERPQLVQLQRRGGGVIRVRGQQGLAQRRERGVFFCSQPLTVLRATPKVRVKPRKLLRSS